MKKIVLSALTFIVALSSANFANCIGDISKVGNAKCITEYDELTSADDLDTITFGLYPQSDASGNTKEPIEWIVLKKEGNKALVLSKYILKQDYWFNYQSIEQVLPNVYHIEDFDENKYLKRLDWDTCYIREWLNNEFYDEAFSGVDDSFIIDSELNCKNNDRKTIDKVFLLSCEDIEKIVPDVDYLQLGNSRSYMETKDTNYAKNTLPFDMPERYTKDFTNNYGKWFFRDTIYCDYNEMHIYNLNADLFTGRGYWSPKYQLNATNGGIRPAMWVSYTGSSNGNNDEANYDENIFGNYNNVEGMAGDTTVTWGMNGIDVTFKRADLKQGWVKDVEGRKFYFNYYDAANEDETKFLTGWREIDGKYYYFTNNGYLLTNTTTPDGYKVGADGALINETNNNQNNYNNNITFPRWEKLDNGQWRYYTDVDADGSLRYAINEWTIDGKTYYFDSDTGYMMTDCVTPAGYYVGTDGVAIIKNGWDTNNGITVYYINGNKARGWTEINGDWYFFGGPDDHLATNGWVGANGRTDDINQYYVDSDGKMLKNTTTPDGYRVDSNGKRIVKSNNSIVERLNQNTVILHLDRKYIKSIIPKKFKDGKFGIHGNDIAYIEIIFRNDIPSEIIKDLGNTFANKRVTDVRDKEVGYVDIAFDKNNASYCRLYIVNYESARDIANYYLSSDEINIRVIYDDTYFDSSTRLSNMNVKQDKAQRNTVIVIISLLILVLIAIFIYKKRKKQNINGRE